MTRIKALTLTEPYATLIALGKKKIETRSWGTDYRGPLAIHAAKGFTRDDYAHAQHLSDDHDLPELRNVTNEFRDPVHAAFATTRGHIVAIATLASVVDLGRVEIGHRFSSGDVVTPLEWALGFYGRERKGFLLTDVRPLLHNPIAAKGALGLWDVDVPTWALDETVQPYDESVTRITKFDADDVFVRDDAKAVADDLFFRAFGRKP